MSMPENLRPMTEDEARVLEETLATLPQYAGWLPLGMGDFEGYSRYWIGPPPEEVGA